MDAQQITNPSMTKAGPKRPSSGVNFPLLKDRDFFVVGLMFVVVLFTLQAIYSVCLWAFAWAFLGVLVIFLRQNVNLPYLLIIELPVFHAIISYSVCVVYLAVEEGVFDLEHDPQLLDAIWVAWWGTLCFLAGLSLSLLGAHGSKIKLSAKNSLKKINVTERQAWKITVFGILCNVLIGRFVPGSLAVAIVVFGYSESVGLFMLLRIYLDQETRWVGTWKFYFWLLAVCWWSIRSVIGGIFGSTLLILGIFFSQYANKSKLLFMGLILSGLIIAPLLQDFKNEYRMRSRDEESHNEQRMGEVFITNFRKVFIYGDFNTYKEGITALACRLATFDTWFKVKLHLDSVRDFTNGQTILDALKTSIIPRVFWSDKPMTGGSPQLAKAFADMPVAEGTSVSIGPISELYINGGVIYIIIGMFIFGYVGGYVLNRGYHDFIQPLGSIMAIAIFSVFIRPECSLADLIGAFIRLVFLWICLRSWILKQNRIRS
jgi:hypothetical protein